MYNVLKKSFLIYTSVFSFGFLNAFAGGFTSGKGVYDFTVEYTGLFNDNDAGASYKEFSQSWEINNEFGITENQYVAFDIFLDKKMILTDNSNNIKSDSGVWERSFQTRHRMNFKVNDSINLGIQNGLGFFDQTDGTYKLRYELRGMIRHDTTSGFYKHSRAELSFRRFFNYDKPDTFRLDLRAKFRALEGVDVLIRSNTYFKFSKNDFIMEKFPNGGNETINSYSFNSGKLKVAYSDLYVGPEFKLKHNDMFYVYLATRVDGTRDNRNHALGALIGYSISLDL